MNQKIEDILEFHKIRHAVREFANTQKAKTMILQLPIETNAQKIRHKIEETRDAVTLLRLKQGIPIRSRSRIKWKRIKRNFKSITNNKSSGYIL